MAAVGSVLAGKESGYPVISREVIVASCVAIGILLALSLALASWANVKIGYAYGIEKVIHCAPGTIILPIALMTLCVIEIGALWAEKLPNKSTATLEESSPPELLDSIPATDVKTQLHEVSSLARHDQANNSSTVPLVDTPQNVIEEMAHEESPDALPNETLETQLHEVSSLARHNQDNNLSTVPLVDIPQNGIEEMAHEESPDALPKEAFENPVPVSPNLALELDCGLVVHTFTKKADCPGWCTLIPVKVGDMVQANTVICVIEIMKMEISYRAGKEGTITDIYIQPNSKIAKGDELFRLQTKEQHV